MLGFSVEVPRSALKCILPNDERKRADIFLHISHGIKYMLSVLRVIVCMVERINQTNANVIFNTVSMRFCDCFQPSFLPMRGYSISGSAPHTALSRRMRQCARMHAHVHLQVSNLCVSECVCACVCICARTWDEARQSVCEKNTCEVR